MGKMLDSTLSWIFEKMAKAYVHRTGSNLPDAKVPVVQDVDGKPYFNLSSIGSADLAKLSGANGIDGTIAEAISGLRSNVFETYSIMVSGNQNGKVLKILLNSYGTPFSGFLLGRRTNANSLCLYHLSGYGEGLGRYNVIDLVGTELSSSMVESIDVNSTENTIKFDIIVPMSSNCYFTFVNFLSKDAVVSFSVEET